MARAPDGRAYATTTLAEAVAVQAGRLLIANPYLEKFIPPGGKFVQYRYSEEDVAERHRRKAEKVAKLEATIKRLRSRAIADAEAGDLRALGVCLMLATYERVGNRESAEAGHFGITGWRKAHFASIRSRYVIAYVGKSGVNQRKEIRDPRLVAVLRRRLSEARHVDPIVAATPAAINDYLSAFGVTSKDLRTHGANSEMAMALRADAGDTMRDRKRKFREALAVVAGRLGHTPAVLRKQYLVAGVEAGYLGV